MIEAGFDIKDDTRFTITTHREWQDVDSDEHFIDRASFIRLVATAYEQGVRFSVLLTELGSDHEIRCYKEAAMNHQRQREIAIGWMYLEHFVDNIQVPEASEA